MDAYQDVCRNPCFRSISDHLSDLCINLLDLGADIADLYCLLIQSFFFAPNLTLNGIWYLRNFCLCRSTAGSVLLLEVLLSETTQQAALSRFFPGIALQSRIALVQTGILKSPSITIRRQSGNPLKLSRNRSTSWSVLLYRTLRLRRLGWTSVLGAGLASLASTESLSCWSLIGFKRFLLLVSTGICDCLSFRGLEL